MANIKKIEAHEAHGILEANPHTLLVCAYEDEDMFLQNHLEGAISLQDFMLRMHSFAKDKPIIFYCADEGEKTSTAQAVNFMIEGFTNVSVLEGGVNAWKEAGWHVLAAT